MARKKPTGKTASVLLFVCLLMGTGVSGVWARGGPGTQLVLVLDSPHAAGDKQTQSLLPQAAGLLIHLLGNQVSLGLVGSGAPDGVICPMAPLTPEHRNQALNTLAQFTPSDPKSPGGVMQQALGALQPEGAPRRVLFWLGREAAGLEVEQVVAQARKAGVTIFAAVMAPSAPVASWQVLTTDTGGRFWKVTTASDLLASCLKLYQYLEQPQEAPITSSRVLLDRRVQQAVLVVEKSAPGEKVTLTDPRKARITSKTRAKNIRWLSGSAYDLITLTRPRPGVWSFSGTRPEVCRVFLTTALLLTDKGTPSEVGEDEALVVRAALQYAPGAPADPALLAGTQFRAELQLNDGRWTTNLTPSGPGHHPGSSSKYNAGRFPPLHQEGEGTLKIWAQGKNFQRLRSLPITITKPWYQVTPQPKEDQAPMSWRFQPDSERRPEQVAGTVAVQSAQGGWGGVFINPDPGAAIILRSPDCRDLCLADLHLAGTAPGGRLLDIASKPLRLGIPQEVKNAPAKSPEKIPQKNGLTLTHKFKRHWIWLALIAVGVVVLLVSALLLFRLRREADDTEDEEDLDGSSGKSILRLKAQVESLAKDKAELEVALQEKNQEINRLLAEKTELEETLDRTQQKSQENLQALEEMEQKLGEAEQEVQGVRQEYMALYARNQQDKESLKKN
jgi:hypothetical protein